MQLNPNTPRIDPNHADIFTYNSGLITFTAAGQTLQGQVNIQADADFWWTHLMAESNDLFSAANNPTFLNFSRFLVVITDTGQQRQLMDVQTPLSAIAGEGPAPFELPWRHRFPRAGAIAWQVQNNTGLAAVTLRLSFVGIKSGPGIPV